MDKIRCADTLIFPSMPLFIVLVLVQLSGSMRKRYWPGNLRSGDGGLPCPLLLQNRASPTVGHLIDTTYV